MLIFKGDFCHKRSIRCRVGQSSPDSCENCLDFGLACTYDRPTKRGRGRQNPPHDEAGIVSEVGITADHDTFSEPARQWSQSENMIEVPISADSATPDASWRAFASVSHSLIAELIDTYFQVVYPM